MSLVIQCNRCECLAEINGKDEKDKAVLAGWIELLDQYSNIFVPQQPFHLCPDCAAAFRVFIEGGVVTAKEAVGEL